MRAVLRRYHGRARRACAPYGAIAQLGERLDRTQEVAGSSPASSIGLRLATPVFRSAIPPGCAFPPPQFPSSRNDTRALAREHSCEMRRRAITTRTEAQLPRRPLALVHGTSCICHTCGNHRPVAAAARPVALAVRNR